MNMNFLRRYSLKYLIFIPFAVVVAYVLISDVLVSRMVRLYLQDYATELAHKKYEAIDTTLATITSKQRKACVHMKNSTIFRQCIENRDPFMKFHMDNDRDGFDMRGYFLLTMDGEILVSDFKNPNMEELQKLVRYVKIHGSATGYDPLLKSASCLHTSELVQFNGADIAVISFVGYVSDNKGYLNALKIQQQIDFITFDNNKFVTTTDSAVVSAELSQDIRMACNDANSVWTGTYETSGKNYYASVIPFFSYENKPSGAMLLCVDDAIVREPVENARGMFMGIGVVLLLIFAFVIYLMSRFVFRPLVSLTSEVAVIATGDLRTNVSHVVSGREIVSLAESVRDMQEGITEVIKPIVTLNETVVSSINHLTTASNNISDSANRQAASLEELSSSMEQMGANIQQNTDNSVETNKMTEAISALITTLGDASQKSYDAINHIAEDIAAINELVAQTNILALNASVEAARAGEQGRGFAVVAKEVGRLADQTQSTAQSINSTASSSTVETARVFEGLNELLPKIQQIVKLINDITVASVEQNAGVAQVNAAILELNKATQENAADAEELDDNAHELRNMLMRISQAVNVFKI